MLVTQLRLCLKMYELLQNVVDEIEQLNRIVTMYLD